ncbi:small heat shock protein p36-like [Antedon mediterranea]|uniref:small heat shock protein p36-like n=1 Tax=Antedon mediterranea TaxID=105859 RepID=UPI003AF4EEC6
MFSLYSPSFVHRPVHSCCRRREPGFGFYNPWTLSDDRFDRHFRRSSVPTFLLLDTFDGKEMRQHKNDALKKKKAACCPRTEEGKFHVGLNLSNFKPDEIDVSLDEDRLKIHAKSETASSEVFKWYSLPENIETDKLTSSLSRDGTLHVIAPFKTITNEPESITSDAKSAKISTESDSMENADKKEDEPSQSEMPPANPPEQDAVAMTTSQNQEPETDSKSGFHVELPMKRFKPEHVNVSIEEHKLKVHAKKIEESDGHFLHEEFTKWFTLPSDADVNQLRSNLQDNGVLVINAPLCATTNALTSPNEESTHNGADDTGEKEVIADGDDADHAQTE